MIEIHIKQYIREAEANHQSEAPLSAPITLPELRTAQRRLNTASCRGKDGIPNAALNNDLYEWQLLLLTLLNAILHLAEFP